MPHALSAFRRSGVGLLRTFCDLLMLVIGVLALVIALLVSLVAASAGDAERLEDERDIANQMATQQKIENDSLKDHAQALDDQLKKGVPIRVVAVVDVSASMQSAIEALRTALTQLAELAPRVTTFEIGVIAFREEPIAVLPLQAVLPPDEDAGHSLASVKAFLSRLEAVTGYSGIDRATLDALEMLQSHPTDAREVLVLLADAGVGEKEFHTPQDADRLVDQVIGWASQAGQDRRVVSIYTGKENDEQRAFFQRLATRDSDVFADESSAVLPAVFQASFAPPKD